MAMTDVEILHACTHASERGKSWNESFRDERQSALNMYVGAPFGDEKLGFSDVVLSDVADTVEWTLPQLIKVFTSGKNIVSFQPVGAEDEDAADQESAFCDHVFWDQNDGFSLIYDWFKAALLVKTGVLKIWWAQQDDTEGEDYRGLLENEVKELLSDPLVTLESRESRDLLVTDPETGQPVPKKVFDISVRRLTNADRIKIETVPADEFLIDPDARDIDTSTFCIHQYTKTRSDLLAMDLDADDSVILDLGTSVSVTTQPRLTPHSNRGGRQYQASNSTNDPSMDEIEINECYIWMDANGDDRAELMQVIYADNTLLHKEEWRATMPFVGICPIPMPDEFVGRSVADQVMDLQYIRSTTVRQMLDNMHRTNNVKWEVPDNITGENTIADLLDDTPGGVVRTEGAGGLHALETPVTWMHAAGILSQLGDERQIRTGLNAFNMGMVPDTQESGRTAAGSMAFRKAANQRIDVVARIFGEGLRRLYLKIHELARKYQDFETTLKLSGGYTSVDPSNWRNRTDAVCRVGMGAMDADDQIQAMQGTLSILMSLQGQENPALKGLASPGNIYAAIKETLELSSVLAPDRFITSPEDAAQQLQQQQQQAEEQAKQQMQQQLELQKLQAEIQMNSQVQLEMAKAQAKTQGDIAKIQAETEAENARVQIQTRSDLVEESQKHDHRLIEQDERAKDAQALAGLQAGTQIFTNGRDSDG